MNEALIARAQYEAQTAKRAAINEACRIAPGGDVRQFRLDLDTLLVADHSRDGAPPELVSPVTDWIDRLSSEGGDVHDLRKHVQAARDARRREWAARNPPPPPPKPCQVIAPVVVTEPKKLPSPEELDARRIREAVDAAVNERLAELGLAPAVPPKPKARDYFDDVREHRDAMARIQERDVEIAASVPVPDIAGKSTEEIVELACAREKQIRELQGCRDPFPSRWSA